MVDANALVYIPKLAFILGPVHDVEAYCLTWSMKSSGDWSNQRRKARVVLIWIE
jgi:hypothetical protein